MTEIDQITGLPKELFVNEKLKLENDTIKIYLKKSKFDKFVTVIEGVSKDSIKEVSKKLKQKFACGGTIKDGHIELQGDHKERLKKALIDLGFNENEIETSA